MNWDIIGHEWAVHLLQGHISRQAIRHAYLFTGPDGVGRKTLALRFIQALQCPEATAPGQPCRVCPVCRKIERMQFPDLAVLSPDEGGTIKVEWIRELQRGLALAPYQGRYRVALLLDFDAANASASNALLKTLEEPPPQVMLFLTAQSSEALLPTIVSRCEVLRLRPLPLEEVAHWLVDKGVEANQAARLAHLSGGRPGIAWQMVEQPELFAQHRRWVEELLELLRAGVVERFAYAETLAKDKTVMSQTLVAWLSYWRDLLLQASGSSVPLANIDRQAEIQGLARYLAISTIRQAIEQIDHTRVLLDRNINPRLAAEVLMLDLPRV